VLEDREAEQLKWSRKSQLLVCKGAKKVCIMYRLSRMPSLALVCIAICTELPVQTWLIIKILQCFLQAAKLLFVFVASPHMLRTCKITLHPRMQRRGEPAQRH